MVTNYARHEGYRVESLPTLSMPSIKLHSDFESTLPPDSRLYRTRLETKLRKLGHLGTVRLRCHSTLAEPFVDILRLERSRERTTPQRTLHHIAGGLTHLREIGRWAERLDALRIYSLELNGESLALIYGVVWRGNYYAIRVACNPNFAMYSPGQLVVMQTLRELSQAGTGEFILVGPALPWTTVWTSSTHQHRSHYIFRPNRHGRAPMASIFTAATVAERMWRALRRG
jgi:CelD/BcsL family acetyltransferase involved in cellulose biosynthesis